MSPLCLALYVVLRVVVFTFGLWCFVFVVVFLRLRFSRLRNEGFSFNSGGLEVGVVFAQRCFGARNRSHEVAKPHNRAALTKCDQDDVLEADFLANSVFCCVLRHASM